MGRDWRMWCSSLNTWIMFFTSRVRMVSTGGDVKGGYRISGEGDEFAP